MLKDVFEQVVLIEHPKRPVVSYAATWNGKRLFHIRSLWQDDDGEWKPGKGLSVPYDQREQLLTALSNLPVTTA
jgi:Transcriptional Coactivator p15 (PC4)